MENWRRLDVTTGTNEHHNVELDGAGWAGRARLTCYTCNVTCLKQPYTNREMWTEKVREFCETHPSKDRIVTSYCKMLMIVFNEATQKE